MSVTLSTGAGHAQVANRVGMGAAERVRRVAGLGSPYWCRPKGRHSLGARTGRPYLALGGCVFVCVVQVSWWGDGRW